MTGERDSLAQQIARRLRAGLGSTGTSTSDPADLPAEVLVDGRAAAATAGLHVRAGSAEFAYTDEPNPSDVATRPDLRVRMHREALERAGELVGQATPWHTDAGPQHAGLTLGLVERLVLDALALTEAAPGSDTPRPLDPPALGAMLAVLGHVTEAIDRLLGASRQQVAAARVPATQGEYLAPPAADPLSELDAILRDLLAAQRHVEMTTTNLDVTGRRLARLTRKTEPPPTPPGPTLKLGGPGPC